MRPLTPEFKLAAACLIWPPSERRRQLVKELSAQVDGPRFSRMTRRHRIAGLVRDAFRRANIPVPADISQEADRTARKALNLAAETCRLEQTFKAAAIPAVFLKGAPLALEAFGDIGLRHSKDVDILVPLEQIRSAWALLENLGYERLTPGPGLSQAQVDYYLDLSKDSLLRHPSRNIEIELHTRLADDAHGAPTPGAATWRRVALGGAAVTTFSETDLFLYLCSHGSGHAWMRLKWLADIGALTTARPDAVEDYWQAAVHSGQAVAVEVALRLSAELLGSPLPKALSDNGSWRVRALMSLSRRALTVGDGVTELNRTLLGRVAEPLAAILLARNAGAALSLMFKSAVSAEDVLLLPLPAGARFLYPVMRIPLWIGKTVGHYGRRSA